MKRFGLFILLLACALSTSATPGFDKSKRYHIVVRQHQQGCVADGAAAGQQTPVYYLLQATTAAYTYWTIAEEQTGLFSIRNAQTGCYVTYDGVRTDTRRYVSMTSAMDGANSLWTITRLEGEPEGIYVIRNAAHTEQVWDVREGSCMVGTYQRSTDISWIESFLFYDEQGRLVTEPAEAANPLEQAALSLTIDGHTPVYVKSLATYLCPIPLSTFGSTYNARIDYTPQAGFGSLVIDGQTVAPGTTHTFNAIGGLHAFSFSSTAADGTTVSGKVCFTSLPVVTMNGTFGNSYTEGSIAVSEPDKGAPATLLMKAKWRGGITNSSGKNKRNYHVKLHDAGGEKLDQRFFGLRSDNSWILEACQVDMSRIRNRVLTDLWNDYATPPYYADQEPKALTGTRGRFVELVLNGDYRGIYCMTEAIDRKQMKLRKYDEDTKTMHGMLWKSKDWSYAVFMGHNSNSNYYPGTAPVTANNRSESWDQYYVKYPDFDDVNPTDWATLRNAVSFVCTASDASFKAHIAEYFDMPLVIDYYILLETILSTDNHGKNMFFGVYDQQQDKRITFSVWDMDATCGQRWSDAYYHWNGMRPEQDYSQYIINNEHGDYNLFRRLRLTDADDFNMKVRMRYRDLRATHLATDRILDRFRAYLGEFKTSGADRREYAKWNGNTDIERRTLNFDTELAYIEDWITRRMNYLDATRFRISELPPSGIEPVRQEAAADDHIYSTNGLRVGTAADIDRLPAGIYIFRGRKIIVK